MAIFYCGQPGCDLMRDRAIFILAVLMGLIVAASAEAEGCQALVHLQFGQPVVIEGVLRSGKAGREEQKPFSYIYLELDQGICVDAPPGEEAQSDSGDDDDFSQSTPEPVTHLQIAGEALDKELPLGTRVKVEGVLFGAHTMWHAEDVLIDATEVTPQ
jgi:hypothetical protein